MDLTLPVLILLIAAIIIWKLDLNSRQSDLFESFSLIDTQFKKRQKIVMEIVNIADENPRFDERMLQEIKSLCGPCSETEELGSRVVLKKLEEARRLSNFMDRLLARISVSTDLAADRAMLEAVRRYRKTEDKILNGLKTYENSAVSLNQSIRNFPGTFLAAIVGVRPMPLIEKK